MITKIKYTLLVAAAGYMLSSCTSLYSSYERPKETLEVDSLFRFIEATNDTTTIASIPWQTFFTDAKLQALIELGLENNTSLAVAHLNVEQAEVALRSARLAYLPTLNATPQAGVSNFNSATTQTYNLSLAASWEVDIFGKIRNAKERSKMAFEQSKAYEQAVKTQLIATIANSYYSLLLLDKQLNISKDTEQNWKENLRTMEALKKAGNANQASVLQSEANTIALAAQIITTEKQIAELENALSALLSVTPQRIERGVLTAVSFPTELSHGVPLQLLSNRPDIRVAEYSLAQAFYATNESRSALYPSITLSGAAGFTNSGGGGITNPGDWLFNAIGSIVQPIFNAGVLRGQVTISKAKQEQALLQFNQAILDAGVEVNNAMTQLQTAQKRLVLDARQVSILTKAVRSSKLLMQNGSANYLEVLTAQNTLLQAELTESSDRYNEIQGVINLYRAVGGGER